MGYHFLLGAVVGAASVLVLGSRRTRELFDKGQHLLKDNLEEGVKAVKATGDCIRDKVQSVPDKSEPAPKQTTPAKKPQRARKPPAKKATSDE